MTHNPREVHFTDAQLDQMYEESKRDVPFVGSEIRQLIGDIRTAREALTASAPGEPQPVAWRYRFITSVQRDWSDWFIVDDKKSVPTRPLPDIEIEPLYTSPPPAPGIKEAFELFNGIVGSPDANGLVTVKIHKDCLARIHNIAAAASRPDDAGIDAAAEYLVQTVKRTLWGSLRKDGRARDGGFEPFPHNPRQEDYRDVVREIVRLAAQSSPDAGGGVRVKPLEWYDEWDDRACADVYSVRKDTMRVDEKYFMARGDEILGWFDGKLAAKAAAQSDHEQRVRSALSKPTDAVNASAEARMRRTVLDVLNGVASAVENLACHQEQADMDGCMVKVSRQALDEVLAAVNEVAIQAATSGWHAGGDEAKKSGATRTFVRQLVDDPNSASGKSLQDVGVRPSSPTADRREIVARIEADPGDGTLHPDLAHVLARGFDTMGWDRPASAAEDMIDAIIAALDGGR